MKHMKFWRTTLIAALVLTIMLSVTGGTIAWFTDTVTSDSNIITSGTLTAAMQWANGKEAIDNAAWKDASAGAIFNYDKWEPGYTEVRHIRIQNTGNLAFKYQLNIVPTGEVSDLADVIDVYYFDGAKQIANRDALANETPLNTLTNVLAGMPASTSGVLLPANTADEDNPDNLPKGEVMVTVALKMQESAGNEYQGKSIGSQFAVQLLATQLAFEEDSFDDQYDSESGMAITVEEPVVLKNIAAALDGTEGMSLVGDGTEESVLTTDYKDYDNLEDYKLKADDLHIAGLTIDSASGESAYYGLAVEGDGTAIENVVVDLVNDTTMQTNFYGLHIVGSNSSVANTKFIGGEKSALFFSDDTAESVTVVDHCEFEAVTRDIVFAGQALKQPIAGAGIRFTGFKGSLNISNSKIDAIHSNGYALYVQNASKDAGKGIVNVTDTTINAQKMEIGRIAALSMTNVAMGNNLRSDLVLDFKVNANSATFTNCHFTGKVKFTHSSYPLNFVNCTFGEGDNKTVITAENANQIF